jgi:hypothetical protein
MSESKAEIRGITCQGVSAGIAQRPDASLGGCDAASEVEAMSGLVYFEPSSQSFPTPVTLVGEEDSAEQSPSELRRHGSNLSLKDLTNRKPLNPRASDRRHDFSRSAAVFQPRSMLKHSISFELSEPSQSSEQMHSQLRQLCDLEMILLDPSDSSRVSAPIEAQSPTQRLKRELTCPESGDLEGSGTASAEQIDPSRTPSSSTPVSEPRPQAAASCGHLENNRISLDCPGQPIEKTTIAQVALRRVGKLSSHLWSKILADARPALQHFSPSSPSLRRVQLRDPACGPGGAAQTESLDYTKPDPASRHKFSFEEDASQAHSVDFRLAPTEKAQPATENGLWKSASDNERNEIEAGLQVEASCWVAFEATQRQTGQPDSYMLDHNPKPQTTTNKKGILMKSKYSQSGVSSMYPTNTEIEQLHPPDDGQGLAQVSNPPKIANKKPRVVFDPNPAIRLVSRYIRTSRPRRTATDCCCCPCTVI